MLKHQIVSGASTLCPRCGKPYTAGFERDHHCGKQIGAERMAPPGVIVESYRLAMGLPPAKDAPANLRASVDKRVDKPVDAVDKRASASVDKPKPVDNISEVDRKPYQREWARKKRADDKAKKAAALSGGQGVAS